MTSQERQEKKDILDAAIVEDLRHGLLHVEIAVRRKVGTNRVYQLAILNDLRRPRGPKPSRAVVNG